MVRQKINTIEKKKANAQSTIHRKNKENLKTLTKKKDKLED